MTRVLILSAANPFGSSALGLTIGSLFKGWDPECLAIVTAETESVMTGRARLVLRWSPAERVTAWQHWVRRCCGTAPEEGGGVVLEPTSREAKRIAIGTRVHETARALRDLTFHAVPAGLRAEVMRFKPHVIYSPLGGATWAHGAAVLSEATSAPVVPHFMDDWLRTMFSASYFSRAWRYWLRREVARALARSTVGLTICDAMAREYEPMLHLPCRSFMRCIEDNTARHTMRTMIHDPLRVVYFGGLHLGRYEVLRAVCDAFLELSATGQAVELEIMVPSSDLRAHGKSFAAFPIVRSISSVSSTDGEARLAEADVALHVESFACRAAAYTRLSVSTKIPSYLRAGLPIIAVGPAHLASVDYVVSNGVGIAVASQYPSTIAATVRAALADSNWIAATGSRARALFVERHEARKVRAAFRAVLDEVAAGGRAQARQ